MPIADDETPNGRARPPRGRRAARIALYGAVALALITAVAAVFLMGDQRPHIERRRSHLVDATAAPVEPSDPGHAVDRVTLVAASGLGVSMSVKRPADTVSDCAGDTARSAVILLGGHRTGERAVHLIDDTRGTVVAAISYPFAGNPRVKGLAIIGEVPAIRRAVLDTPAAVMLAVDYVSRLPCVDPARIEAVGVSLGAPFAIIASAMDSRISRVWAVHGAGGIYAPLEFNLRRQLGSRAFSVPVAVIASVLLSGEQLAPERWAPEIAPRPLLMINALDDERIPRESVERLYRTAAEPKEMIWLPGAHVRSEAEAVRPLIDLVLSRIVADTGAGPRTAYAPLRSPGRLEAPAVH